MSREPREPSTAPDSCAIGDSTLALDGAEEETRMNERRMWAIVLAGGEGSRLAETTQRMYGSRLPKQFLSFGQARTFLQMTIDRLRGLVPRQDVERRDAASEDAVEDL